MALSWTGLNFVRDNNKKLTFQQNKVRVTRLGNTLVSKDKIKCKKLTFLLYL